MECAERRDIVATRSRLPRRSAAVAVLLACGTGGGGQLVTHPPPPLSEVAVRLYLIGDAGAPAPGFEPVLAALRGDLARDPDRSFVVFLGDNVYPRGLPDSSSPDRAEAERRLQAQLRAVLDAGARGLLVPGNHDWAKQAEDGWDAVRRQGRYVDEHGAGRLALLPEGGCPGPAVRDVGEVLRLVLVDTPWWLHDGPKPRDPSSDCGADSELEVVDSLRRALETAGSRVVVVAAHHPLNTGGVHGGSFGIESHLFPLRAVKSWLWVPLPGIGSLYPLARKWGISDQDLAGSANRAMREALRRAFADHTPLVYAAGHDHDLQVLADTSVGYVVVSGTGYYGHASRVSRIDATLFAASAAGYMRLDIGPDRRARLGVVVVSEDGSGEEAFAMWLN